MTLKSESISKLESDLISKKFDGFSKSFIKDDNAGLSNSAKHQIKQIIKDKNLVHSVVDVGSGAGGILAELVSLGIEKGTGIDLSPKMIEAAKSRIEKCCENKVNFIQGNFVDIELENHDAISMHKVMCCYFDSNALLNKAISLNPEVIAFTLLRERFLTKSIGKILFFLKKVRPSTFIIHVHKLKHLDQVLLKSGYTMVNEMKSGFIWTTRTYKKQGTD